MTLLGMAATVNDSGGVLASIRMGSIQFDSPIWLVLIPALGAITLGLAARSLSGLGAVTRWTAISVRLAVITMLAGALAQPNWRKDAKDVAVTAIVDVSDSIARDLRADAARYVAEARLKTESIGARLGVVTVSRDARVQSLPSQLNTAVEVGDVGTTDSTNLAAALRLAMAVAPTDAGYRILLASDGNETDGSLLKAAELAKSLKIPVDVLPLRYRADAEVLVDRIVSPGTAREGENISLRVVLNATAATTGSLAILMDGEPIDLDPAGTGTTARVTLEAGQNVKTVQVPAMQRGAQKFQAVFTPDSRNGEVVGDRIAENNRSVGVTFVAGEGRVLVIADSEEQSGPLVRVLAEASIKAEVVTSAAAPRSLTEFNNYDCIVMMNQASYSYTQKQQEELKQYVHDTGGGLVMLGGPESFGAGGWIGSPLEDALPIRLDPPQKRQMPKGALALVIHSCEMPQGVFWGKKVCESAVNALSRLDLIGINEWSGMATTWVHEMQPVGDGSKAKRAINNLRWGDMPDFTPSLTATFEGLLKAKREMGAGQCHAIIISDGDPQTPPQSLLDKFVREKITISTVGVFPHGGTDTSRMAYISKQTNGRHYEVNTDGALAKIPQIFIKEAQTIRRSLINESTFTPKINPVGVDAMRGITSIPEINGYVVAADRGGLSLVSLQSKEGDPILAQWQHGLGRVLAYTSDASTRWNSRWVEWSNFKAFWEQHIRWAMRPAGNANVRVSTEAKGDRTLISVEALDSAGERLNFATFKGRMSSPDGSGVDVEFKQVGPGLYQSSAPTGASGLHILGLRYAAPDETTGRMVEGSVQAAVSRPFSDEYRSIRDNAALLEQVATTTGGRVLSLDAGPQQGDKDLWVRTLADGTPLAMPSASRPIWLLFATLGIGLFLVDVGVRRVRIDVPAMVRAAARAFGRSKATGGEQIGSLRAAREKARAKIAERELTAAERAAARGSEKAAEKAAAATAKTKFEASADQIKRSATTVALGGADAKPEPIRAPGANDQIRKAAEAGEGLSRLMQAKKKARDEMSES